MEYMTVVGKVGCRQESLVKEIKADKLSQRTGSISAFHQQENFTAQRTALTDESLWHHQRKF